MRLNRSKFVAWLKAKRPDEIIGRGGYITDCPIARFHKEASGGHEVVVSSCDGITIDRGDGPRPAPVWAAWFARCVDDEPGTREITARRALELLSG